MEGLTNTRWEKTNSPFGPTSDDLLYGELEGETIVFLPRHGRGHKIPPTELPFRANIDALKRAGCESIVSLSAVGSLRDDLHPGELVIVDQFVDRTFARVKTFFETGMVAHVSMAHPVCGSLGDALMAASQDINANVHRGGTYLVMEGPQFSSKAESELYRSWGCDVIGMTNMPEAKLAREAEICYATVAMVTDYDCWHEDHEHVTVDQIIAVLQRNAANAQALIRHAVHELKTTRGACDHGCRTALEFALITQPEARDPNVLKKLDAVAGRVLE